MGDIRSFTLNPFASYVWEKEKERREREIERFVKAFELQFSSRKILFHVKIVTYVPIK